MSEKFFPDLLHDQLDEALSAIIAGGEATAFTEQVLADLTMVGSELRGLPREPLDAERGEERRQRKRQPRAELRDALLRALVSSALELGDVPVEDRIHVVLSARDSRQAFAGELLDPPRS